MDTKAILSFIACIGIIMVFGKTFLMPVKKIIKFGIIIYVWGIKYEYSKFIK